MNNPCPFGLPEEKIIFVKFRKTPGIINTVANPIHQVLTMTPQTAANAAAHLFANIIPNLAIFLFHHSASFTEIPKAL